MDYLCSAQHNFTTTESSESRKFIQFWKWAEHCSDKQRRVKEKLQKSLYYFCSLALITNGHKWTESIYTHTSNFIILREYQIVSLMLLLPISMHES